VASSGADIYIYSGTSHTVEHLIQWNISYSGSSHTVEHLIQWNISYSGTSHTVEHLIQWNISYSGTSHIEYIKLLNMFATFRSVQCIPKT